MTVGLLGDKLGLDAAPGIGLHGCGLGAPVNAVIQFAQNHIAVSCSAASVCSSPKVGALGASIIVVVKGHAHVDELVFFDIGEG